MINDELLGWWGDGDRADSKIAKSKVTSGCFDNIIAFQSAKKGDPILVVAQFFGLASVNPTHSDDSAPIHYDSDEELLMILDTIRSQSDFELTIDVSFSIAGDDENNPEEMKVLEFQCERFSYIEIDPHER